MKKNELDKFPDYSGCIPDRSSHPNQVDESVLRQKEVKALSMLLDAFLLVRGDDFAITRLGDYAQSLVQTSLAAMFIEDGLKMINEIGMRINKAKKELDELTEYKQSN